MIHKRRSKIQGQENFCGELGPNVLRWNSVSCEKCLSLKTLPTIPPIKPRLPSSPTDFKLSSQFERIIELSKYMRDNLGRIDVWMVEAKKRALKNPNDTGLMGEAISIEVGLDTLDFMLDESIPSNVRMPLAPREDSITSA